jgi:hypothetical protein
MFVYFYMTLFRETIAVLSYRVILSIYTSVSEKYVTLIFRIEYGGNKVHSITSQKTVILNYQNFRIYNIISLVSFSSLRSVIKHEY